MFGDCQTGESFDFLTMWGGISMMSNMQMLFAFSRRLAGQICLLLLRKWTKVPIQKHILHNHKNLVLQDIKGLKSSSEVAPYLFFATFFPNIFQTSPKIMGFLPFSAQLQPRENPKVLHWPPTTPMMRQQPQWQQRRRRFFARLGEVWKPRWVGDVFCCWPKKG